MTQLLGEQERQCASVRLSEANLHTYLNDLRIWRQRQKLKLNGYATPLPGKMPKAIHYV